MVEVVLFYDQQNDRLGNDHIETDYKQDPQTSSLLLGLMTERDHDMDQASYPSIAQRNQFYQVNGH